jgi:REP element-mobilizing transposase RayT
MMTLHAYGSWLPDRREGYVHYNRRLQPQDEHLARVYRERQAQGSARFDKPTQQAAVDVLLECEKPLRLKMHAICVDPSHLHALYDWRHDRDGLDVAKSLRHSLTRRLNQRIGRRKWFTHRGHLRIVKDRDHFVHLRDVYIPSHDGSVWRHVEPE